MEYDFKGELEIFLSDSPRFRILNKNGKYDYFDFTKPFNFNPANYDKDAQIEYGSGFFDLNHKEMFQNDIVKYQDEEDAEFTEYHRVQYDSESDFCICGQVLQHDRTNCEIVSNIHKGEFKPIFDSGFEVEWVKVEND